MRSQRGKVMFGVGAGMVSLAVDGIASLVVLRLLKQYLPAAVAGFWVLIMAAGSLLLLLQFGMGPVVTRVVARTLESPDAPGRLPAILGAVRFCFLIITGLVGVVSVLAWLLYLGPAAARETPAIRGGGLGWFLYAAGIAANLLGQARLFVLNGLGEIGWDKVLRTVFASIGLVATAGVLLAGQGLAVMGALFLAQNLCFLLAARWKVRRHLPVVERGTGTDWAEVRPLLAGGMNIFVLNLIAYAIANFGVFVVERRFGVATVTPFSAMLKMGTLAASVSTLVPQMLYPYVASGFAAGRGERCRQLYRLGVLGAVATYLAIALPIVFLGERLFDLWLGPGAFLGQPALLAFLGFFLVYVNHSAQSTPVLAASGATFLVPAVVNGILVVGLVLGLAGPLGIPGIPIGMIVGTLIPSAYVTAYAWSFFRRLGRGGSAPMPA